jgi:hypothetical protein
LISRDHIRNETGGSFG